MNMIEKLSMEYSYRLEKKAYIISAEGHAVYGITVDELRALREGFAAGFQAARQRIFEATQSYEIGTPSEILNFGEDEVDE